MKNYIKILAQSIFILTLLVGCSSDSESEENNEATYEEMIIGKWIVEYQWEGVPKEHYEDYVGLPQTDPDNTEDYTQLIESTTFLFKTDGTVFINEWGDEYTKEYYIEGNDLFLSGFNPQDVWLSRKIYSFTSNYLIARKSCNNNDCDDDWVEVRYYKKID